MDRIALIVNRDSGSAPDAAALAAAIGRHGAEVEVLGIDRVQDVASVRPDRLVVAGGDGSIAAVARMAATIGAPLGVIRREL